MLNDWETPPTVEGVIVRAWIAGAVVGQHVGLAAVAGVFELLIREACQSPVVPAVGAVHVPAVVLRQSLRRKGADFGG